jgi:hypothetical protein
VEADANKKQHHFRSSPGRKVCTMAAVGLIPKQLLYVLSLFFFIYAHELTFYKR